VDALGLVRLTALMERTSGSAAVTIGLIDGPVATEHPQLTGERFRELAGPHRAACTRTDSTACLHGTFVAGILSAKRDSEAPAICPDCPVVVRSIFAEAAPARDRGPDRENDRRHDRGIERMPSATPAELAAAIVECIEAGARVINLSLGLTHPSIRGEQCLADALDRAARRGVIIVAAAGNQGAVGSSAITHHPWVIPVVACDARGRPTNESNLGNSIGRRGLSAPGDGITSLGAAGQTLTLGGTSVAAPFVTGAAALLWSAFPSASAADIRRAITGAAPRRASVVPPLLNAAASLSFMDD
jgi:subtilisin family serine protease